MDFVRTSDLDASSFFHGATWLRRATGIAFACLTLGVSVFGASDFVLEPAEGYVGSYQRLHKYGTNVRDVLLKNATDAPIAMVVVLESFAPERATVIEERDGRFNIVHLVAAESIWIHPKPQNITIAVTRLEIDKSLAAQIGDVFFAATSRTGYSEEPPAPVTDQDFYDFVAWKGLRKPRWEDALSTRESAWIRAKGVYRPIAAIRFVKA
jgi:hypothetical protein